MTPMNHASGLKVGNQNSTNYTPPTPSIPKFNQSVGPGRAPSPLGKKSSRPPSRPSLPRPESPIRRLQMTPNPRPPMATPGSKVPSRYGSPTNKFSQSVRGTAQDPAKRGLKSARDAGIGPRSASAIGNRAPSAAALTDDESLPIGLGRSGTNGSVGSISSFQAKLQRPPSRANGRGSPHRRNGSEDLERLRQDLADRDRQLKEQVQLVMEMETSLTELQNFISKQGSQQPGARRGSEDDKDAAQLRTLLREKNEKIAMLTAEFDAHRADFRSTIDTLEMASTETERVYEKKLEDVMQELHDYQERTTDVNAVAKQLKQLEELVQELEEGLEDARRGEAEARGEVEFLRGEVERTRSELRREREKAAAGANGAGAGDGNAGSVSKELEQKEDEIRGLKAIIHSLSREGVPGLPPDDAGKTATSAHVGLLGKRSEDSASDRFARERLEREVAELRALLDAKNSREEEILRELEALRRSGGGASSPVLTKNNRSSAATIVPLSNGNDRSSVRDSRDTVILAQNQQQQKPGHQLKNSNGEEPRSPPRTKTHVRMATLDTMPESDVYSVATENSTLYCELCETSGHGILNCTNMFPGNGGAGESDNGKTASSSTLAKSGLDVPPDSADAPAPLSPVKTKSPTAPTPTHTQDAASKAYPDPMGSGPVAGKDSKVIDVDKWCALCERDGHDSVDCPFEDVAF